MGELNIRQGRSGDAAALAAVHGACFERPWTREAFQTLLNQSGVTALIGVVDEHPLGFVLLRAVIDEAEILTIAVDPAQQRRGYGEALLRAALTRLADDGVQTCFLEVAEDNPAAIALYRRAGFRTNGTRPNYYQRQHGAGIQDSANMNVDALRMVKMLS